MCVQITVNGVAPALIEDTKMLPGNNGELSKSEYLYFVSPESKEAFMYPTIVEFVKLLSPDA